MELRFTRHRGSIRDTSCVPRTSDHASRLRPPCRDSVTFVVSAFPLCLFRAASASKAPRGARYVGGCGARRIDRSRQRLPERPPAKTGPYRRADRVQTLSQNLETIAAMPMTKRSSISVADEIIAILSDTLGTRSTGRDDVRRPQCLLPRAMPLGSSAASSYWMRQSLIPAPTISRSPKALPPEGIPPALKPITVRTRSPAPPSCREARADGGSPGRARP